MQYLFTFLIAFPILIHAQNKRPEIFFREDFKETPAEIPVSNKHIANSDLAISLYGESSQSIKKSHHAEPYDDPYYVWSGECKKNWAVTLKHKTKYVNLSQQAKIKWRSKQTGFRALHIILKLADSTWLIGNITDTSSNDWRIKEFNLQDFKWMTFDNQRILERNWVESPDLTKVEEIGWTDLMHGGGSEASSRIDWIEVYGYPIDK